MKMLRITLEGKSYDVGVEVLDSGLNRTPPAARQPTETAPAAPAAPLTPAPPPAAAPPSPPPVAAPAATPAPAAVPAAADASCRDVTSPMAGVVLKCLVRPGDRVEFNQMVMVLDAMKMETPIHAPLAGTVRNVQVREGDAVEEGHTLLQIEGQSP